MFAVGFVYRILLSYVLRTVTMGLGVTREG